MNTRDRTITLHNEFLPGHEYEVVVQAVDINGRVEEAEHSPKASVYINGKTASPDPCTGLSATGGIVKISLTWTNPVNYDYYATKIYRASSDDSDLATLVAEVSGTAWTDEVGSTGVKYYYWVLARNTSGKESALTASVNATTTAVTPTDLADFSVTASKIYTKIPIVDSDSWTNNSPGAGEIAWNAHSLYYNGAKHNISASNTSDKYVYWALSNPSNYQTSNTAPTQIDSLFIIATNISGTHNVAWNSIANQVIGSAYILDAAITTAKIDDLAVTSAKVTNLSATKITSGTISAIPYQTAAGIIGCFLLPDVNTGIRVSHASYKVFECLIAGVDIGDVYIGNYDGGAGCLWDQSATKFTVKGVLEIAATSTGIANLSDAGDLAVKDDVGAADCDVTIISGGKIITGLLTATNIQTGTLDADLVTVDNLTATMVEAGTLTGSTIQTASGTGHRIIMSHADNTLKMYDASNHVVLTIDDDANGYAIVGYVADKEFTQIQGGSVWLWTETGARVVLGVEYYHGAAWDYTVELDCYGNLNLVHGAYASGGILRCREAHAIVEYNVGGTKVVGAQGATVADSTDAVDVILRLNDLLARCRAHGLIAT